MAWATVTALVGCSYVEKIEKVRNNRKRYFSYFVTYGESAIGLFRDVEWNKIWSWDVRETGPFVKMHKKNPKTDPGFVQLAQRTFVRLVLANCPKTRQKKFFYSLKGVIKGG